LVFLDVENQQDVAVNQQHLPDEQAAHPISDPSKSAVEKVKFLGHNISVRSHNARRKKKIFISYHILNYSFFIVQTPCVHNFCQKIF
jgi:hypothetical protein